MSKMLRPSEIATCEDCSTIIWTSNLTSVNHNYITAYTILVNHIGVASYIAIHIIYHIAHSDEQDLSSRGLPMSHPHSPRAIDSTDAYCDLGCQSETELKSASTEDLTIISIDGYMSP